MRFPILRPACLLSVGMCFAAQMGRAQSFEVASITPASPSESAISCKGGPGTTDPGLWRCSNVPLGFLISKVYGFEAYQLRPNDPCCRERFDFDGKVPQGTTREQFNRMIQTLLEERFKLKLHLVKKEMAIYKLSLADGGLKMKQSEARSASETEDTWSPPPTFTVGKDGYPVFAEGRAGVAGASGHYRWVGFDVSMQEMVKTLSFYLGRPVIDVTGLTGRYQVNLKWWIDVSWLLESSGHQDDIKDLSDAGRPGPTLIRAVQEQLGLKLTPGKGQGDVVVIDHLEKAPTRN